MVTDTAMVRKAGKVYAFGPVVRELDVFLDLFEKVEWIGFDRQDMLNDPVMLPVPEEVRCILLPRSGGNSMVHKVGVMAHTPLMLWTIFQRTLRHQVIHTRAPSSPAFLALVLSFFLRNKTWWHKYAGNWGQEKPPFFFGFQRACLKMAFWSKVTINGRWPGQPAHCLSFENPCLEEAERVAGAQVIARKRYNGPLSLCFVGHLNAAKGADKLIDLISRLPSDRIAAMHIVGDGPLRAQFESLVHRLPFPLVLHGYASRAQVGEVMSECHLLLLPSQSEGFAKVIAEGANYGCVPVVSDVSATSQYVRHGVSGFLLSPDRIAQGYLHEDLQVALQFSDLKSVAMEAHRMAGAFTFERYRERIQKDILPL